MMVNSLTKNRLLFVLRAGLGPFLLLQGCAEFRPIPNQPLHQWDHTNGYRFTNLASADTGNTDSLLIIMAFSGGGTRASTLAFGALRELARHQIHWEGNQKRLLDELDVMYAVSGGAFTAGYYALRGEQIFHDFEARFLRKNWERELKLRVLRSPRNWIRLWSPYFGRSHLLAEILNEALFEDATYEDLLKRRQRPWLSIHASDMATLSRFEFHQSQFDMICSDLSQLSLAWAAAASAALPLVLSPMTVRNYAGQCEYQLPAWLTEQTSKSGIASQRAQEVLSYQDLEKRPHIHLLDGGLSDNLALRGLIESTALTGGLENLFNVAKIKGVRKLVVLLVNAETAPDVLQYQSDRIPIVSRALRAMVDVPINRYSFETIMLMRQSLEKTQLQLRATPRKGDSPFAPDADIYFIDASLSKVTDADERRTLMKIPTTLYLSDSQIEQLLLTASKLIRNDPEFQRLLQDLKATP